MPYAWDSYTRNLVRGWSKLGMTAAQIHDAWPWQKNRPSVTEVLRLQLHLSTGTEDDEKPLKRR